MTKGSVEGQVKSLPAAITSLNENPVWLSDDEARKLLSSVKWYHRFELRLGLVTPGCADFPGADVCDMFGLAKDLTGLRAVDIGTWDGPLAFRMERRGAHVVALDIQDPNRVGFAVARRILQSKVPHVRASVYDLPHLGLGQFDIVMFRGVYYHLKYPLLAFEQIAKVLKLGGRLCFEGEAAINYIENVDGQRVECDLAALDRLRIPACFSYPNRFKGGCNWFIPNTACMESWLTACGFKTVTINKGVLEQPPHGGQRMYGVAEKVSEQSEQIEHPLY